LLLEHGDSASIRNHRGLYPSDVAVQLNFDSLATKLRDHVRKFQVDCNWTEIQFPRPLPVRFHHSTTVVGEFIFIIGGCNHSNRSEATEYYSSIIKLDLNNNQWEEFQQEKLKIAGHSVSLVGNILYISGGFFGPSENQLHHELLSLNTETFECIQLQTLNDTPHYFHQSICMSRLNISFFACKPNTDENAAKYFNMIHLYDIKNNAFLKLPTMSTSSGCPAYREQYSAHKVGEKVLLFGGKYKGILYDDLWEYDAKANSWTALFPSGHRPTPRYLHAAATTSTHYFVFGGHDQAQDRTLDDFYGLDTKQTRWVSYHFGSSLPPPREGCYSLFSFQNNIYAFGGVFASSPSLIQLMEKENETKSKELNGSPALDIQQSPKDSPVDTKESSFKRRLGTVSMLTKELDAARTSDTSEHIRAFLDSRTLAPAGKRKKKQTVSELMDAANELEEYSDTLCQDVLHFIAILRPMTEGKAPSTLIDGQDALQVLSGMCQDLTQFIDEQKPPEVFGQSSVIHSKLKLKAKTGGGGGGSNTCQFFTIKTYCMQHYESLQLPPPFVEDARPDSFQSQDKMLQTRFHLVNELLSTETEYVRDLGAVVGFFIKPLGNEFKDIINQYDFNSLFKNLESILEFNRRFLSDLQDEYKKPAEEQNFGGVFLSHMDGFKKYLVYCANQSSAGETLTKLERENVEFNQYKDTCATLLPSKKQQLDSFIIKPFQRICRYPLLLKELRKNTPSNWPTYSNILTAISEINVIVQATNDSKKHTDSLVEIMEIQNRFVLGPGDTDLMQMHKWTFIKFDTLRIVDKKTKFSSKLITFVLFREVIVIAQPKGKKLYRLYTFPSEHLQVIDSEIHDKKKHFIFCVVNTTDNSKFDVAASSLEEKNSWITSLRECASYWSQ